MTTTTTTKSRSSMNGNNGKVNGYDGGSTRSHRTSEDERLLRTPVVLTGWAAAWERLIYIIYIHWIAIKWTFIQLFSRHRSFNTEKLETREAQLAIVTGGASGIGAETVRKLYACDMHVIIASPDLDAAHKLRDEIMSEGNNHSYGGIQVAYLDLRSISSIGDFVRGITERNTRIQLLINNAGVMFCPHATTEDGFEVNMQVNYLGPFLLTYWLLPLLKTGGTSSRYSRVINVSSVCHYASGGLDLDTDFTLNTNIYKAYANSKLMQILHTNYLNTMMKINNSHVMCVSVHPGIVNTDLYKNVVYFRWVRPLMKLIYKSPAQAADTVVFAALSDELENEGGTFIGNCKIQEPHFECRNLDLQKNLWNRSCTMFYLQRAPRASSRLCRPTNYLQQNKNP